MSLDRRRFLGAGLAGAAWLGAGLPGCADHPGAAPVEPGTNPFRHGVASGDPWPDRVILWTRVSPERDRLGEPIAVDWWIAHDEQGRERVAGGRVEARPDRDHTVKVDATGLEPGRTYFYRFETRAGRSPLGRTRTLAGEGAEHVRIVFASCSNLPHGFFNAYASIAHRDDLDAVVHLGDYLYEYANEGYGDGRELGRISDPDRELVTLADYRRRHACYKRDPDLQAAHARHPWITVWDDHESANNAWREGAQNHQPEAGEGEWTPRKLAAIRAYHEWMPIRTLPTGLHRRFRFGGLVDLILLDTRLAGRDEQVGPRDHRGADSPERTLLGAEQERWLFDALSGSKGDGTPWRVIGQQVVFSPLHDGEGPFNPDSWDGYRESRRRLLDHLADHSIDDVIFLTGDVHSAWAMDVPGAGSARDAYDPETGRGSRAVELVTPAISSRPIGKHPEARENLEKARERLPYVRYLNAEENGYGLLELTPQRALAQWIFVETVARRSAAERPGPVFEVRSGASHLRPLAPDSRDRQEARAAARAGAA